MLVRLARAIASHPIFYQWIQLALGQRDVRRELRIALKATDTRFVLDVGSASGGLTRELLSKSAALDIDLRSLARVRQWGGDAHPVAASAATLPFVNGAFRTTLCVGVAHHLDDDTLEGALQEIARVTKEHFVFLDGRGDDPRRISRLLWRYDRGAFPRSRADLLAAISRRFEIESEVTFRRFHSYVLYVARPR